MHIATVVWKIQFRQRELPFVNFVGDRSDLFSGKRWRPFGFQFVLFLGELGTGSNNSDCFESLNNILRVTIFIVFSGEGLEIELMGEVGNLSLSESETCPSK